MKQLANYKKYLPYFVGALIAMILSIGVYIEQHNEEIYITYPTFLSYMEEGQIKQVVLNGTDSMSFSVVGDGTHYITDHPESDTLKEQLLIHNIRVREANVEEQLAMMQSMISLAIFGGLFFMMFRNLRRQGSGNGQMALQVSATQVADLKVGFSDIAGNIEAKDQVKDVIDFIKEPEKYSTLGAKMPKGLIFYGPPGTGKTLMAKAIAKEAEVPFFSVSGSDFVQMYVGVGASRIRELFKEARKHEKAVIFIDEIDAIGKKRSQSSTGSNEEKDQTLNALLTEMSGFKSEDGIVVIAATNRLELLDEALLRPGRFDRHIEIGYPDKNAREQIIKLYLKEKPVDESVNVKDIVKQTVYFTGAMLENLLNEAAILAANDNSQTIGKVHVDKAFYIVIAGAEKKDRSYITDKERAITAYHEAGHALVTKLVAPENCIAKVTIIPTSKGAGGFSMNIPKDKMYQTKRDFINQIQIALGGRIAEEMIFGKDQITTGSSNDIEKATKFLKEYIEKYGMHESVGFLNMEVLGFNASQLDQDPLKLYREEMERIYNETKQLVELHQGQLAIFAEALLQEETLEEERINELFQVAS